MKKIVLLMCLCGASVTAFAADPVISDVLVGQLSNRLVEVSYKLANARAIVTPVFKLNGSVVDSKTCVSLGGDVRRVVAPGERRFIWDVRRDWKEPEVRTEDLSVELTAWKISAPPSKMVIDLDPKVISSPSNVLYYVSEEDLPGGVGDACYRKGKLLMTLVPAAEVRWRMGTGTTAGSKYVTLSKDFYISAFVFTQGQGAVALGTPGSANKDHEDAPLCPMEVSYEQLRLQKYGSEAVPAGSYLHTLRKNTGLDLDLPSEFQWEFAIRAGMSSERPAAGPDGLSEYGYWGRNCTGSWGRCERCTRGYPHPVGELRKNDFGLYDIIGNVREYTRTCYSALDTTEERDPEGSIPDRNNCLRRSGGHGDWADSQLFHYRASLWYTSTSNGVGFRLVLPVEKED